YPCPPWRARLPTRRTRPSLFPYTPLFRSRETVSALEAVMEALNEHNRILVSLAAQTNEQLAAMRGRVGELSAQIDVRAAELANSDRKSTRLNSSHVKISYAVFSLKKKEFR